MSAHRPWDRDAQPAPSWARNLVRRSYLIAAQTDGGDPPEERVFETSHACAVGDVVAVPPAVLPPHEGGGSWLIVERQAADSPYVARLTVVPA
jgi:hypothetical protein